MANKQPETNEYRLLTADLTIINALPTQHYQTIVGEVPLNEIIGINRLFVAVHSLLPDNGTWECRFISQSTTKKEFLERFPKGINYVFYSFFFLFKRVMPRLYLTDTLYFRCLKDRQRVLSKAEVLGRLVYCGFEIKNIKKKNGLICVEAMKKNSPHIPINRHYGVFISLPRIGQKHKIISIFKLRTMHPYSEYLQEYMYEHYRLQDGGKIRRDIRVSNVGHCLRRYWIDELPMLLNLLKGDIKLVGVRPLSEAFFNLYSADLQAQRVKFKPGLLPPFYADIPRTMPQIETSERTYLNKCEQDGEAQTDWVYFKKIMKNILFHHAHSH